MNPAVYATILASIGPAVSGAFAAVRESLRAQSDFKETLESLRPENLSQHRVALPEMFYWCPVCRTQEDEFETVYTHFREHPRGLLNSDGLVVDCRNGCGEMIKGRLPEKAEGVLDDFL